MAHEVWKDCPSEPGYQVSDLGRVRSVDRVVTTASGPRAYRGRVLTPGTTSSGHKTVACGKGNSRTVHSLVLEAFVGRGDEKQEALHGNGNPGDNRLSNLRWGSRSENLKDLTAHGGRKLTLQQAREARTRCAAGESRAALAKEFWVCPSNMGYIVSGRYYG